MMVRRSIPLWIIIGFISRTVCGSALSDLEHHLLHNTTSLSEHHLASLISEGSAPSEHSQYLHIPDEYISNAGGLLNKHYPPSRPMIHAYRNPHFVDIESHQRRIASHYASEGKQDYRSPSYHDHQPMHSAPDYDIAPLKKHDYGGNHNYGGGGGWDMFSGGLNLGSGFAGQAVKKGKEAKALFILMAPLILLAVFGPFLATQAMIPWITNGGLTSVSTIATGKRKKRSNYDPRQMAELEKRLQLFMEVQEFIAKTGSPDFAEEMGEAFLQCHKYSERRNKCLERIACEYTDETSAMDQAERRIAKMVLQNVMSNPMVSASIKGRLSKGSMFGKNHRGRCRSYWCEAIDRSKEKS